MDLNNDFNINMIEKRETKWLTISQMIEKRENLDTLIRQNIIKIIHDNHESILVYQTPISRNQFLLGIDSKDLRSASISILSNGHYEIGIETILEYLKPTIKSFLDVGSNVGFYSIFMQAISRECKVYSVEPNAEVRKRFERNLLMNNLEDAVLIFPFGVGKERITANLFVPPNSGTGAGSLRNLHPEEGIPKIQIIEVRPFNEILKQVEKVDLIKMDIEGGEFDALNNASSYIAENMPIVIAELLRKWMKPFKSHPQDVIDLFIQLHYKCFAISNDGIRKISTVDETTVETNFLFYPPSKNLSLLDKVIQH